MILIKGMIVQIRDYLLRVFQPTNFLEDIHQTFFSSKSHGGNGSPEQSNSKYDCDGVGLMSYDPTPNKWSSCSKSDFQVQYKEVGAANWCMPGMYLKNRI